MTAVLYWTARGQLSDVKLYGQREAVCEVCQAKTRAVGEYIQVDGSL
jgi:hypothetical protein